MLNGAHPPMSESMPFSMYRYHHMRVACGSVLCTRSTNFVQISLGIDWLWPAYENHWRSTAHEWHTIKKIEERSRNPEPASTLLRCGIRVPIVPNPNTVSGYFDIGNPACFAASWLMRQIIICLATGHTCDKWCRYELYSPGEMMFIGSVSTYTEKKNSSTTLLECVVLLCGTFESVVGMLFFHM